MIAYSIKDLENLTGIKAHTLRIWEKRYGIINPSRTITNIRYFTEGDVEKILHITLLNRKGNKISKIAKMTNHEIIKQVAKYTDVNESFENDLDALMMAIFELDSVKFNILLDNHIHFRGFEYVIDGVFYPLLDKLSVMWMGGSVKSVHEAFVTNAIRRKLIHQIENIKSKEFNSEMKFLIYLSEYESNELSALFVEYILAKNNIKVINLGINVPLIDVLEASYIYGATHIFTIFNDSFPESTLQLYLNELSKNVNHTKIMISGFQATNQSLSLNDNTTMINGLADFKKVLDIKD
jgi:MerR family transcriptional regulator, light-induced transcriptional regulator